MDVTTLKQRIDDLLVTVDSQDENRWAEDALALETLRPHLLKARVEAARLLSEKREQMRTPAPIKGEARLTDLDRTTMLSAAVAPLQAEVDLLAGLEVLVADRISLLRQLI